jgi:hypothetical protein
MRSVTVVVAGIEVRHDADVAHLLEWTSRAITWG